MIFFISVSADGDSTRLCHKWNDFWLFWFKFECAWLWLAQKITSELEMVFFWRSHESFSLRSNVYHHLKQYNYLSMFVKRIIRHVRPGFALFCSDRNWMFCWLKGKQNFGLSILDHTQLQYQLELIFSSLQKNKFIDQTSRKTNFFVLQRKHCAPDTWTSIEHLDSRFFQESGKPFRARKIYPKTLYSDKTRSQ